MMRHKTKCDWLLYLSVMRPLGLALANESYHRFQTFSRQSEGLATRDYEYLGQSDFFNAQVSTDVFLIKFCMSLI